MAELIVTASDRIWFNPEDVDYPTLNALASASFGTNNVGVYIGQRNYVFLERIYNIHRVGLIFDTSSIPAGATISSAVLRIYVNSISTTIAFDVVIQNGQPTYPHDPPEQGDFNRGNYSGDGGSINTDDLTTSQYNDITLTIDWITKAGQTKLMLRSSRDISATPPEEDAYNWIYIGGKTNRPRLVITYEPIAVTTEAASSIGVDHAKGNGTATGAGPTERGFEVRLAFSGTLREAINRSIAGFEGDFTYNTSTGKWEGTLVKTITETGSFAAESFVGDLGRFPIAVVTDKLFAAETYDYRACAIMDGETYYGDWVEFTTASYPSGEGPDDVISPAIPIVEDVSEEEITPFWVWPEIVFPPWEWPEFEFPPFEIDIDITFGRIFGAFLRKLDTKKDWITLREKCIIYQENMNQFTLTINHNTLVLKNLVNDIITYINGDVYPSDLKLMNSSQQLTPLYLEPISPDGFKDIINDFRLKDVHNVYDLNQNFKKLLNSLNSLYESDYSIEPISYNTREYMDIQPTAKRMILQLEDMRKKSKEVRRLIIKNVKRIFTYV